MQSAFPVTLVVVPEALVDGSVWPEQLARAVHYAVAPVTLVCGEVLVDHGTGAVTL